MDLFARKVTEMAGRFSECWWENIKSNCDVETERASCGAYGYVFKGKMKGTGQEVAVKVITIREEQFESEQWKDELYHEVRHLLQGHHSVVELIGFSLKMSDEDPRPAMVMKWMANGSLDDLLKKERAGTAPANWTPTAKSICIFRIVTSMSHVHDGLHLIHRDLKPGHIMVDEECLPYLGGFGLAIPAPAEGYVKLDGNPYGTPVFMAPELFSDEDDEKYTN
jgi:interleukin-1 receptor-associated kinase 1